MKPKPYVGITGFKTVEEVDEGITSYRRHGFFDEDSSWQAMFGFVLSEKRLRDPGSMGTSSCSLDDLFALAERVPDNALPAVHYFTTQRGLLFDQVREVFERNGLYASGACRALQINMTMPLIEQIDRIKQKFPDMKVIFQLTEEAMCGGNLSIEERVASYARHIDYVLVDPSRGYGKEIDVGLVEMVGMLDNSLSNVGVGFAGGLCGESVADKYELFSREVENKLSIDAQGKLRTCDKNRLDFLAVDSYLKAASHI